MKKILLAFLLTAGLIGVSAPAAQATVDHCPNHNVPPNVKDESGADDNDLVLDAGLNICVKSGGQNSQNTGIIVTDGESTLQDYLEAAGIVNHKGNVRDVSYWVLYPVPQNGEDGEDGEDGRTPIVFCVPGVGIGFVFDEENLPDGAEILEEGEVCPLTGEDGEDGTNGQNGEDGAPGPQGLAGPAGKDGVTSHTSEVINTTVVGCPDGTVVGLGAACPNEETTPTTTAPPAPTGELPRTGANGTLVLLGVAAGLIGLGFGFRKLFA